MVAPFAGCNESSISKKNQALKHATLSMPMTHELLWAIEAAHDKLAKYYNETEGDTSAFITLV